MTKPVLVTSGDPAGVGPEVAAKAWGELRTSVPFVWMGDPDTLPPNTPVRVINDCKSIGQITADALPVIPHKFTNPVVAGKPDFANAQTVIDIIENAVQFAKSGQVAGICTGPISKAVLQNGAGFEYPGHTEFLAALDGKSDVVMMLVSPMLRVVPVTIHIPIDRVAKELSASMIERCLEITHTALQTQFDIAAPTIAVAGLNPHAGEDGRMGRQELDMIAPLLENLRAKGMNLRGPLPADTMFHARARAGYDAAVCMYHDQALIPIKTLDFDGGVNTTLGLSFVRTSPDHGTAFDIAGKNLANPSSTIAAVKLAAELGNRT